MTENGDAALRKIILDRITGQGKITFAEFMSYCLYEPGLGYYTSPGKKVGAEGDFYTSSNVHQVFGRLIAREIHRMWQTMAEPAEFDIVEVGAGNGRLAADVMNALSGLDPRFYAAATCRLIEAEPSLRELQQEMLKEHLHKVDWSAPADLASGRISISGCLYSNELIDSFPVHLVEWTEEGLREVYVTATEEEFGEIIAEPSTPELATYLERLGMALHTGQRAEINLAAPAWLKSVAAALTRGYVMTIDYGFPAVELYTPMRKNGSLLCYYRHTIEENPYIRVGQQDITSHVDFTTLIHAGEAAGLETVWFGEQYRFLMGTGIMAEMMAMENSDMPESERLKNRLGLKKLMLPDGGMGDTFKVLIQAKGMDNPRLLCMRDWGTAL